MAGLKEYCQKKEIGLLFALFPHLTDKYPIPEAAIFDFIGEARMMLGKESIDYLDLRSAFKSRIGSFEAVRLGENDVCHLNAQGHKISSEILYDYLQGHLKR